MMRVKSEIEQVMQASLTNEHFCRLLILLRGGGCEGMERDRLGFHCHCVSVSQRVNSIEKK